MKKRKGVFLTLGITFVSILVLTLASLVLRNAESSEERMTELAALDRIYNLDRSLGTIYKEIFLNVLQFNMTINETYIKFDKFLTNVSADTDEDRAVIDMLYSLYYADSLYSGFSYLLTATSTNYIWYEFDRPKVRLLYYIAKNASTGIPGFEVGGTPFIVLTIDPKLVKDYTVIVKHKSLNGTVNWTDYTPEPSPCIDPYASTYGCGHTLNVTVLGTGGWVSSDKRSISLDIDPTGNLTQKIYILNYTTDPVITPFVGAGTIGSGGGILADATVTGVVSFVHNLTFTFLINYYPNNKTTLSMLGDTIGIEIPELGIKKFGRIKVL